MVEAAAQQCECASGHRNVLLTRVKMVGFMNILTTIEKCSVLYKNKEEKMEAQKNEEMKEGSLCLDVAGTHAKRC